MDATKMMTVNDSSSVFATASSSSLAGFLLPTVGPLVNFTTAPPSNSSFAGSSATIYSPLFKAMCALAGLFFLPGVFGNSLIVAMTCKYRKLRIPTNYFICSLAIADLMVMAVMVAFIGYVLQPRIDLPREVKKFLFPSLDILVGSASILNLAAVSIDRAIAVVRPLRYASLIHDRAATKIIAGVWLYSFGMFTLSMLRAWITDDGYRLIMLTTALVASFLIPCTSILVCYFVVLLSALRNIKFTKTLERAVLGSIPNRDGSQNPTSSNNNLHRMKLKELRIAMNIIVIVAPFTLGWGFFFGSHWYELFKGVKITNDWFNWLLVVIPWFISSINPVIYILLTRQLRNCCYDFFCHKAAQRKRQAMLLTPPSRQVTTELEHNAIPDIPQDSISEDTNPPYSRITRLSSTDTCVELLFSKKPRLNGYSETESLCGKNANGKI